MGMYEEEVRVSDLDEDELRQLIQAVIDRLGVQVIRECTPDYTTIELRG